MENKTVEMVVKDLLSADNQKKKKKKRPRWFGLVEYKESLILGQALLCQSVFLNLLLSSVDRAINWL